MEVHVDFSMEKKKLTVLCESYHHVDQRNVKLMCVFIKKEAVLLNDYLIEYI